MHAHMRKTTLLIALLLCLCFTHLTATTVTTADNVALPDMDCGEGC